MEIKHTCDLAKDNGTLHRYGKLDRPIRDFDYTYMYISAALSVAYFALVLFSVPQIGAWAMYAQHTAFFSHAQWISLATATALTIAMGVWNELYVKPYDLAYQKQHMIAAAVTAAAARS
jgi:hypothetical protein